MSYIQEPETCGVCGCFVGGGCPQSTDEERESYELYIKQLQTFSSTKVEIASPGLPPLSVH